MTHVRTPFKIVVADPMRFVWDESKNYLNLKRHRLRFETATLVFEDPRAVTLRDSSHDEIEERFITIGHVGDRILVYVVHTDFEIEGEEGISNHLGAESDSAGKGDL